MRFKFYYMTAEGRVHELKSERARRSSTCQAMAIVAEEVNVHKFVQRYQGGDALIFETDLGFIEYKFEGSS